MSASVGRSAIDLRFFAVGVMIGTQPFGAQSMGHRDGRRVVRVDAMVDLGPAKMIDRPVDRGAHAFGRVALSPMSRKDSPADFRRRAFRLPWSDAADPPPRTLFDDGEKTATP